MIHHGIKESLLAGRREVACEKIGINNQEQSVHTVYKIQDNIEHHVCKWSAWNSSHLRYRVIIGQPQF